MAFCHFEHFYIADFLMHSISFELHARVLKVHIWIPHVKWVIRFFFLSGLCPVPELWPFEKIWMKSCRQNISKHIKAKALKFEE